MTTTASFYLFHKSTSISWHEHNSTSIWHDHIKFLSYPQEHQQFDLATAASFYFSTRTLAVSDMTPITTPAYDVTTTSSFYPIHKNNNSTSLWHDHNSSKFYLSTRTQTLLTWAQQYQHLTWPQHQVSILYTRTPAIWHGHHSNFLL